MTDFARDMFLFSLYARGMNYVDMAYLKKSNIKKRSRHNVVYNLRSIGKQYKFSVSPTIAMTKDLWRKIMDEVSVSEVI